MHLVNPTRRKSSVQRISDSAKDMSVRYKGNWTERLLQVTKPSHDTFSGDEKLRNLRLLHGEYHENFMQISQEKKWQNTATQV